MQAISLYWLAAQHQARTLRQQKIGLFDAKFSAYFMNLVFSCKGNRKLPKMAKTKVVRENANWRRSEAKG